MAGTEPGWDCAQPGRRTVLQLGLQLAAGAAATTCAPSPAASSTDASARIGAVLTRLLGRQAAQIHARLIPDARLPWHRVSHARDGGILVTGNTPVAVIRGAYAALWRVGAAYAGWDGNRVDPRIPWHSLVPGEEQAAFAHRLYLNPCTYGYTTPFWDEARWTREIDWMALHGVDMPLALEGQDYVWRALWRAEGLGDADLAAYFSGPAFLPWQRMGNIEGYRGPLPDGWFGRKRDLQRHILAEMRGLGMEPILPAFGGYVPRAFAERHREARIYRMIPWGGFHETYWLDPADPLFAPLARRFLDLYDATYGAGNYYLADAFNEMLPPVAGDGRRDADGFLIAGKPDPSLPPATRDGRLARYGRALSDSITRSRPHAHWVTQGWMFSYQKDFWSPDAVEAFLSQVPSDRTLILDLANDSHPGTWERDRAFGGKRWVFGYINNFGGNNPLTGDLALYRRDLTTLPDRPDRGRLSGIGLFPEGLNSNPVVYDYIFDQAWRPSSRPVDDWLRDYARGRYGKVTPAMHAAWVALAGLFYRRPNWDFGWQGGFGTYLFCKRPHREALAVPFDIDLAAARAVAKRFAAQAGDFHGTALYRHDLVSVVTHVASLHLDAWLRQAAAALERGDGEGARGARARIEAIVPMVDLLMGAQPIGLASWLAEARAYGETPEEVACYVDNARAQVTIWGGDGALSDYASKAWQGLYEDYYLPRWRTYLDALRDGGGRVDEADTTARLSRWGEAWVARTDRPVRREPADAVALATAILDGLEGGR